MLTDDVVEQIKDLLREGLTHRRIEQITGISRGSVYRIATGKRSPPAPRRREDLDPEVAHGAKHRCPQCGVMVYGRCLACFLREHPVTPIPRQRRHVGDRRRSKPMEAEADRPGPSEHAVVVEEGPEGLRS